MKTSENSRDEVPSFGIEVIAGLEADMLESTSQREFNPNYGSTEFSEKYISVADLSSFSTVLPRPIGTDSRNLRNMESFKRRGD